MIMEFVTFDLPEDFTDDDLMEDARSTVDHWQANPDLIRKHFVKGEDGTVMGLYPTFPKWHAVGRQDRQLSLIDQAFWGLDGACMDPNARMRAGRCANPHHFGPASPFFSAVDRPVLPLSFSCCQDRGHAHIGGARNR